MFTLASMLAMATALGADEPASRHFETKVRPLLASKCLSCHSAKAGKIKGGLDLSSAEGLKKGGANGPAVNARDPDGSLIMKAVRHLDDNLKMPPSGKLADEAIRELEQWIRQGAFYPQNPPGSKAEPLWSIAALARPPVPKPQDADWAWSDIDRFVRASQEKAGVRPVADATPERLFRRLFLDLTGLPPSPSEVEAFLGNPTRAAYAREVDRLLASQAFGEKWGRHWLDVARFAETTGKQVNFSYPHAWRYRNWVIDAFNSDMPHAEFVTRQLAGDLVEETDPKFRDANRVATGFLAVGAKALNERNATQFAMDMADEQIDATTQAFLGLTIACARCHDHKHDPVSQAEYTALAAIFRSTDTCYGTIRVVQAQHPSRLLWLSESSPPGREPLSAGEIESLKNRSRSFSEEIENLRKSDPAAVFNSLRGVRLRLQQGVVQGRLELYHDNGEPKRLAMGVKDRFFQVDVPIYERGEIEHPGETVKRGLPSQLGGSPEPIRKGSGRLELARWIAGHPLSARVAVNRIWQRLMGRGLVPGGDNFGSAGNPPTNPGLLDWLASEFLARGGSTKSLIRQIVTSRAYQLGHEGDPLGMDKDPENATSWRHERRRLDAEVLRDCLLAVSGSLDRNPPAGTLLPQPSEGPAMPPMAFGQGEIQTRKRSIYLPVIRDGAPESLALFDGADPNLVVPERHPTTTPAQGLFLLNNPEMTRCSEALARKVLEEPGTEAERVNRLAMAVWGRPARPRETESAIAFLEAFVLKRGGLPSRARVEAYSALAQAQLASADFLFVP